MTIHRLHDTSGTTHCRIGRVTPRAISEIEPFPGVSALNSDASRVLAYAMERGMTEVVISGFDSDGQEYFASNLADGADALWHLERCKKALLSHGDAHQARTPPCRSPS